MKAQRLCDFRFNFVVFFFLRTKRKKYTYQRSPAPSLALVRPNSTRWTIFITPGFYASEIIPSIGGHTCGMFMSSMKMISRLPGVGPYVSFVRFSTFVSRLRCTSREVVRLEKLMFNSSCNIEIPSSVLHAHSSFTRADD